MKILSYLAVLLSVIGIGAGIYCQIEYVPKLTEEAAEIFGDTLYYAYSETAFNLGSIALFVGGLGLLAGIMPGIKGQKLGWIAVVLGFVSVIFGLLQATHMFD